MNHFDEIIKEKTKLEQITLPIGFQERNDKLLASLTANSNTTYNQIRYLRFRYQFVTALFIFIIFIGSVTVAADCITGGKLFSQFFMNNAVNNRNLDYSYMNTDQLAEISTDSIGTVVETDELTIEVLDAVSSGNSANVMIKVTANKLESVFYDNQLLTLKNYRFYEEESDLEQSVASGSISYYYSDQDKCLAPNQFKIVFTFTDIDTIKTGNHTFKLDQFGYYSDNMEFQPVYEDSWQFNIAFASHADYSKELWINQSITAEDVTFELLNIMITPFTCTINLKTNTPYTAEIYQVYFDKKPDIKIKLKDGTMIDSRHFTQTFGADAESNLYNAILYFTVPISVKDVESISVFNVEYPIN